MPICIRCERELPQDVFPSKRSGPYWPNRCKPCCNRVVHERKKRLKVNGTFWIRRLSQLRRSATQRNLEFEISARDLSALWDKQQGRCAITNREMNQLKAGKTDFFTASVDRIEPHIGYTLNNIRFILHGLNTIKQDKTNDEFMERNEELIRTLSV